MNVFLAPDVYVNASVAPGTAPDRVVQRLLGQHKGETAASEWVLERVDALLGQTPAFKPEAIPSHVQLIRSLVRVLPGKGDFGPDAWEKALAAGAKAAGASRVITDHPDLLKLESHGGVDFVSTEAWLFEVTMPPPVPAK